MTEIKVDLTGSAIKTFRTVTSGLCAISFYAQASILAIIWLAEIQVVFTTTAIESGHTETTS
jgi:hypothetical protein